MASPTDLKFTESHEWIRVDDDNATIGISDYAQSELGDITYLELPDVGSTISAREPLGVIESVKAATDVYAPVSGEVVERNEAAINQPELVNQSPYRDAWLLKITLSDPAQLDTLMDSTAYDAFLENETH
ncbi:glycine cleavage system protein GcvH [soil metagenome]